MHRRALVLALAVIAVGVGLADMLAPRVVSIGPGSVTLGPETASLESQPFDPRWDDPHCEQPDPGQEPPCPRRYAFTPDAELTAWISLRNGGPIAVELDGMATWLEQYDDVVLLAAPIGALDGGGIEDGVGELMGQPYEPITLGAGDERIIGVRFRTATDVARVCSQWEDGGGVSWDHATLTWHWLLVRHEVTIPFERPITFHAPSSSQCLP